MTKHVDTTEDTAYETGDFESILERSADEIKEPGRPPTGPWVLRCVGTLLQKTSAEDLEADPSRPLGTVIFVHTPFEPLDGVDPDAVEEGSWRGAKIFTRRNIKGPGDDYNVLQLAKLHGVDTTGRSLKEVLEATRGRMVQGTVGLDKPYTSKVTGEQVINSKISNFVAVA